MRYPWKDYYGMKIELGDYVRDKKHEIIGYVELNNRGVPCIHTVEKLVRGGWITVDNKGPIEAYQYPLFDEYKSKFYWWWRRYYLPYITILLKGYK